jgi:hypothetical protein
MPSDAVTAGRLVVGLIGSGAGGVETIRDGFVGPASTLGWQVAITLTPTAARWLDGTGERARLEHATGFPVRSEPRMPDERSPHPPVDCWVIAPASANTVAKLALGLADNQAVSTAVEAIGHGAVPVVVFPRVNAAHVRHPAWESHVATLQSAGVHLVQGPDVWPLHEPRRTVFDRPLPWPAIINLVEQLTKPG